jgi:predicted transcriptional regulator
MTSLTIQLDDRTNKRLIELSRREHLRPEALVEDTLRRRLFIDWLDAINMTFSERAKRLGFENEDDLLNAIS